jgi:hypothetical protein
MNFTRHDYVGAGLQPGAAIPLAVRVCVRTPVFVRARLQFTQRYEGPCRQLVSYSPVGAGLAPPGVNAGTL